MVKTISSDTTGKTNTINHLQDIFFVMLFATASFGQLGRLSVLNSLLHIYLHEVLMVTFLVFVAFRLTFNPSVRKAFIAALRPFRQLCVAIGVLIGVLCVSFIASVFNDTFLQNIVAGAYLLRLVLYFGYFLALMGLKKLLGQSLARGLTFFAFLTILFSCIQLILYPNLRNLLYLGWDPHLGRAFGTLFDTSTAGAIFIILMYWTQGRFQSLVSLILSFLFFLLTILSFSRANYIGLILSGVYYSSRKYRNTIVLIILFVCFVLLIPTPKGEGGSLLRSYTITARLKNYQEAYAIIKAHPFLGVGYNKIQFQRTRDRGHAASAFSSSYLSILASSGLIGLGAFLYYLQSLFLVAKKMGRTIVIVCAAASLFDNVFLVNFVMLLLFTVIADES